MKILFMGTPEFAIPSLEALARGRHRIAAVVTQVDRPRGRSLVVSATPVKKRALELGLAVLEPLKLSDRQFSEEVVKISPDLIVVVAYGNFLPRSLWSLPPKGTINLHPSLLPKYRGAAPIAHAILNGESETGVTVLYISEKMDAGDVIAQDRVPVLPSDTCGSLSSRLAEAGSRLLAGVIDDIESGRASRTPQDDKAATLAPKIEKSGGLIDWNLSAEEISRRVRAFNPWPGACTFLESRGEKMMLKIIEAGIEIGAGGAAGLIGRCDIDGIHVGTGSGCLLLKRLQPEGRKVMSAAEFARGHRTLQGRKLG